MSPTKAAAPAPPACADMSTHQGLFNICISYSPGCTSSGPVDLQIRDLSRPQQQTAHPRWGTTASLALFSWPLDAAPYQAGTVALQPDAANRAGLVEHGDCASERRAEASLLWRSPSSTDEAQTHHRGRWRAAGSYAPGSIGSRVQRAGLVGWGLKSRENFGTPFLNVVCIRLGADFEDRVENRASSRKAGAAVPSLSFFFSRTMPQDCFLACTSIRVRFV